MGDFSVFPTDKRYEVRHAVRQLASKWVMAHGGENGFFLLASPTPAPVHHRRAVRFRRSLVSVRQAWLKLPSNVRGVFWILMASFLFVCMVSMIKAVGQRLHITQILWFRQLTMFMCVLPVIISGLPGSLVTKRPDLQLVRISGALTAMLLSFTAVIYLPLADATTISFAKPFFVTIFAVIFLREVVGLRRWMAIAVGFVGVAIVLNPTGENTLTGYGIMALGGSVMAGLVMVTVRKLTQTDPPSTILLYQAVGIALLITPFAFYFWKLPQAGEWLLLIAIGLVSYVMQMLTIFAYRAGEASVVSSAEYTRLIYAVLIGFVVFSEWPEPRVFAGAAIIIAAVIYTLHRERQVKGAGKASG